MIVTTEELPRLAGSVTMVDGGFDPLHPGHVAYLREAAQLGLPVLCNIAPDSWVERKHPPLLVQSERALVIDALRDVDYTHAAGEATAEVIRRLRPRYLVKGGDWRGRLPEADASACADARTEVVFVDTVLGSSTELLRRYAERAKPRR